MSKKLIVVAALLSILTFSGTTSASLFGVKLDPENKLSSFEFSYDGGNVIEGEVTIVNMEKDTPVSVRLSGTDAKINTTGNFYYKSSDEEQTKIGKWLTVEEPITEVQAGESAQVKFKIELPEKITPGIYAGGISAEEVTAAKKTTASEGFSATVKTRIIKKILLNVEGEVISKFNFNSYAFKENKSNKIFYFNIENEGNTLLAAEGQIDIKNSNGSIVDTIPVSAKGILQEESFNGAYNWADYPQWGKYEATITMVISEYDPFTETYTQLETVSDSVSFELTNYPSIMPYIYGIIAFLILLILWIIKKKLYLSKCVEYITKEDDTIQSIANETGMNWKKMVKINHIKPPYDVQPGMKLLIRPKKNANNVPTQQ